VQTGAPFYEALLEQIQNTPGVSRAGLVELEPLTLANRTARVWKDGEEPPVDRRLLTLAVTNNVSPTYFTTIGIPVLAGRDFSATDRADTPQVAIINETLGRRLWPDKSPLGQRFRTGAPPGTEVVLEVVGIVRDSKYVSVTEDARPAFYRPLSQRFATSVTILAKTIGEPSALLPAVQSRIRALDPDLAVIAAGTLEADTQLTLLPVRLAAAVATSLGLVALVLTILGIYGVMSYLVRQRTREVGIRLALGAKRSEVIRLLARAGLVWTAIGIGLGLLGAFAVTRLLGALLYRVSPNDPIIFVGVAGVLVATGCAACYIPGLLATRANPLDALRTE
jgi:predicted permease